MTKCLHTATMASWSFLMCLRQYLVPIFTSSIITHVLYNGIIPVISTQTVSTHEILPTNFTIDGFVDSHQVRLIWSVPSFVGIARFILVHKEEGSNSRTITEIEPEYTVFTLRDLKELTTYLIYLETVYKNGTTVRSDVIRVDTPEADDQNRDVSATAGKGIILLMVFALWLCAIMHFVRTWRKKMNLRMTSQGVVTESPVRASKSPRNSGANWQPKHQAGPRYSVA